MSDEYLSGVYAPVRDEADHRCLAVRGEIPSGLRGTFLRNGPNPVFAPKGQYHLWDGDGMLHAVRFDDDGVHYLNRQIETAGLRVEREVGRALYGGLMDPDPPPVALTGEGNRIKNPANTNIIRHAARLLALWEGGLPTVLTDELETLGTDDFAGKLRGPMTAHPKIDPETGEMFFFGYSPMPPFLRFHAVDRAGKLVRSVDLDLPRAIMMHDFAITRNHVVFLDGPVVFDFAGFAESGQMLRWAPEHGSRIGVMRRDGDGSDIRWMDVPPCYVFHFLNAHDVEEDGGERIRVTAAAADWVLIDFENEKAPEGVDDNSYLFEFDVDLARDACSVSRIGELPGEFCKVPDAVVGLPHRYGYLSSFSSGRVDGAAFDAVTKVDLQRRTETTFVLDPDEIVGEVSFAPDAAGHAEDDGWLVTWVHRRDGTTSDCAVFDARDVAAGPIARVPIPQRVPLGFHGNWFDLP